MAKLIRIGVFSAAKLQAALMGLIGLIFGLFLGVLFGIAEGGLWLALVVTIIVPAFYAIHGFITGAIMAWLYNLAAGWVGGIEVELDQ